jgi:hypothetical protein
MSPGPRRDLTPFIVVLVAGAVGLFLLVGGLAYVGRSSGPYHATIDESFAAQARIVVGESNAVGAQLETLIDEMVTYRRIQLARALDSVVTGAQSVASEAALSSSPAPDGPAGPEFLQAMTDRALGMERLRTTVDGLLALTPGTGSSPLPPPAVSAAQAVKGVTAIGQLLVGADRSYQLARRAFSVVPGGSKLPPSVWVAQPVVWGAGAVDTTVNQLTSSPELAPLLDVHLVAISLTPSVLPAAPQVQGQPQAPPLVAGASQVPPTCTLSVTAVIRNDGTVVAIKVPVEASVQAVTGGPPFPVKKQVTLAPSASVALTLPDMPVAPGITYSLSVTLQPPAGQSRSSGGRGATIAVASFGSSTGNQRCARVPAAAP